MQPGDLWSSNVPELAAGGSFTLLGTLLPYFTTTLTTYTPRVLGSPASPGTLGTIFNASINWSSACGSTPDPARHGLGCTGVGVPYGNCNGFQTGTCVGATVHDTTSSLEWEIETDLGGGLAIITTPFAIGIGNPTPAEGTPLAGDTLIVGRWPLFNTYSLSPVHAGMTAAFGQATYQGLSFNAPGGYAMFTVGGGTWLIEDTFGTATQTASWVGGSPFYALNVDRAAALTFVTSCFLAPSLSTIGPFNGSALLVGGAINGAGNVFTDGTILTGDVLLPLRSHNSGTITLSNVYLGQTNSADGPPVTYYLAPQGYGPPALWGPGGVNLTFGGKMAIYGTSYAAGFLAPIMAMGVNGQTTRGFAFNYGTLQWQGPYTLTPANVDAHGSLVDPGTGAAFVTY
jgi:hypothetical protein